jgi:hypothetical protein
MVLCLTLNVVVLGMWWLTHCDSNRYSIDEHTSGVVLELSDAIGMWVPDKARTSLRVLLVSEDHRAKKIRHKDVRRRVCCPGTSKLEGSQ